MKGPEKDLNKTVTIPSYPSIYLSIWISSGYVESRQFQSRLVHQEQLVAPVISLTWWQSPDSGRLYVNVGLSCSFGCMLSESTPLVEFVRVGDWWAVIPTSPFATLVVFKYQHWQLIFACNNLARHTGPNSIPRSCFLLATDSRLHHWCKRAAPL